MAGAAAVAAAAAAAAAPAAILALHGAVWRWSARPRRRSGASLVRSATLRALGLVYFAAFATLLLNLEACFGDDGLEPVALLMQSKGRRDDMAWPELWRRFLDTPTFLWFTDAPSAPTALRACGVLGLAISAAVAFGGVSHCAALALQWLLFLSAVNVGQRMLGYGWHPQLCEFGFLCIFLGTPLRLRADHGGGHGRGHDDDGAAEHSGGGGGDGLCPEVVVVGLLRLLLFRSLFEPGLGKIFGGDPAWWPQLSALTFHYFTQPSPNPWAWAMHALPQGAHVVSCLVNHVVECLLPVCLLLPWPLPRHAAACLVLIFMSVLVLTGNYAYLQYLMLAQTVPAFNNDALAWALGAPAAATAAAPAAAPAAAEKGTSTAGRRPWPREALRLGWHALRWALGAGLAITIVRKSVAPLSEALAGDRASDHSYDRWHIVNGYAAFSHMTKSRPEVVIEVRTGHGGWEPVHFWCKVGDPRQRPCTISPLDLPIDWSMWFVPLGDVYQHPWFFVLLHKILCGSPAVTALLRHVPGNATEVRAQIYEYTFTSHTLDWSVALQPAAHLVSEVWSCASRRAGPWPWDFLPRLAACAGDGDGGHGAELRAAVGAAAAYLRRAWADDDGWWQRRLVKQAVPPLSEPHLSELLSHNGLPSSCFGASTQPAAAGSPGPRRTPRPSGGEL